jgi:hypothetical protein
MWMLRYSP